VSARRAVREREEERGLAGVGGGKGEREGERGNTSSIQSCWSEGNLAATRSLPSFIIECRLTRFSPFVLKINC
jgi:hypothetical protein